MWRAPPRDLGSGAVPRPQCFHPYTGSPLSLLRQPADPAGPGFVPARGGGGPGDAPGELHPILTAAACRGRDSQLRPQCAQRSGSQPPHPESGPTGTPEPSCSSGQPSFSGSPRPPPPDSKDGAADPGQDPAFWSWPLAQAKTSSLQQAAQGVSAASAAARCLACRMAWGVQGEAD